MTIVFVEGKFIEEKEASIPLTDRGFLFGDGLFSTLRVFEGKIEGFKTHLAHLRNQCDTINLKYPEIKDEWLRELVQRNQAFKGVWRLKILVTGGDSPSLDLKQRQGRLIMLIKPVETLSPQAQNLCIYPIPYSVPLGCIKSLSYLDRLYMANHAREKNLDDVLTISCEGHLLESSFANIFWKENDHFFSPESSNLLLKGSTLTLLSKQLDILFVKKKLEEILETAQIFLCSSIRGIVPVIQIEDRKFTRDIKLEETLLKEYTSALLKDTLL